MQTSINELIEKYANIATSTIGHVLDEGHLAQIHAINRIHHVTGRVRTARLASINAMNLRDALLQSEPNDVLVIDARAIPNRACWGEQRHRAAIYHQLAAVVVIECLLRWTLLLAMSFCSLHPSSATVTLTGQIPYKLLHSMYMVLTSTV